MSMIVATEQERFPCCDHCGWCGTSVDDWPGHDAPCRRGCDDILTPEVEEQLVAAGALRPR